PTRKRLIIGTAAGATAVLLLAITGLITRPHLLRKAVDSKAANIADYQKRADQGEAFAQDSLGMFYEYGMEGATKDLRKAAEFYQKAADQGNTAAEFNLGRLYYNGQGVPKDLGKAVEFCQKAADEGNADAQYQLGWLYYNGQGLAKDFGKAAELYQKA